MSLSEEELRQLAEAMKHSINQMGIEDFDGYSPAEMSEMIYHPLTADCPIQLNKISEELYHQIPMLSQVLYIVNRIRETGKLKLTNTGKLPVKLVAEIYALGYLKDELIEKGIYSLYKEEDSMSIHMTHILLQLAGIVRKSKGFLYVTAKGEKLTHQPWDLLKALLLAFGEKFNWGYFDGYGDHPIGKLGWTYSISLMLKYGAVSRPFSFYAEKYFLAFPTLLTAVERGDARNCYSIRTFERFMCLFGLTSLKKDYSNDLTNEVKATPLLQALFSATPPGNYQDKKWN